MGELKLIGAQRVKALTNMLNEQEQAAIASVPILRPSHEESLAYADDKAGLGDLRMVYDEAIEKAKYYSKKMQEATGVRHEVRIGVYSVPMSGEKDWIQHFNNDRRGNANEHDRIRKEFQNKRNALWLCETLEEAKAIVGIE